MTTLRFLGDFGLVPSLLLALLLAAAAWALYRRDVAGRSNLVRRLLPLLRGAAVFLAAMMLAGPVLHHRRVVGELLRLHVVLDGSQSMALRDPQMDAGRKLMIANRLGWTDTTALDADLLRAADRLAAVRDELAGGAAGTVPVFKVFAAAVEAAAKDLEKVQPAALQGVVGSGTISYERWNGISGSSLDGIWSRSEMKAAAQVSESLKELASRFNADDFVERLRGYVIPPVSGDYTFWVCSDDDSEVWLSTSDDPALKSLIARVQGFAPYDSWDTQSSQKSRRIPLQAGRRYYVEVLHKEGGGEAHVIVRWTLPDGRMESPVPGSRLAPFAAGGSGGADPRPLFSAEVVQPARQLADRPAGDAEARKQFENLQRSAVAWEREFRDAFARHAETLAAEGNASVKAVLDRFDRTTRWERMTALLWGGRQPALARMAEDHDIELSLLEGTNLVSIWRPRAGRQEAQVAIPEAATRPPGAPFTDVASFLGDGAGANAAQASDAERTPGEAYVLLSDGAHNGAASPVTAARAAGARGVPVFTVAVGTDRHPADAAIRAVVAPESVFHKDRLRGRLVIDDRLPAGRPLPLQILASNKVVWSQDLRATGEGARFVDFDLPVEELAKAAMGPGGDDVLRSGVRLDLRAEIGAVEGDAEAANNARAFETFAVLREYKVLIVDSRPRWEWRYLDNLFDRDRKWKVNSVLIGDGPLKRGREKGQFPADREELFSYDLVVLGDIAFDAFRKDELEILRDFVGQRGGGLILIDSARGQLRSREAGALEPALPATWDASAGAQFAASLRLAAGAEKLPALDLGPATSGNGPAWQELPGPHQVVALKPKAGAETVIEAVSREGKPMPAAIHGRFGAGQVLHLAFDETWRWRYRVADRHHARFWNQVATWLMESPYAARDGRGSVDAGAPSYQPGERAPIRLRLRDREGRAMSGATAFASLFRDGRRVASIPLAADESGGGTYRADTAALEPGTYEVRATIAGEPEDAIKATVSFVVRAKDAGELSRLTADETLLRQMASASRGSFHREEDLDALLAELKPLSRGRIVESETVLWQSWPWFALLIALITVEWLVRKKEGML